MHDVVLVEDLMKENAAVGWLVFERAKTDEEVVHLLIDSRIVQEPRGALFRIGISGAQNAERGKEIERLEPNQLCVATTHRQAGNRPPVRGGLRAVGFVDERNDFRPQFLLEQIKRQLGVLWIAAMHDLVI